jgi:hypothetical protein
MLHCKLVESTNKYILRASLEVATFKQGMFKADMNGAIICSASAIQGII